MKLKSFWKNLNFWMSYGHSRLLLHDALVIWATLFSMSIVGEGSNPALANNWRPLGDLKSSWSGHALLVCNLAVAILCELQSWSLIILMENLVIVKLSKQFDIYPKVWIYWYIHFILGNSITFSQFKVRK